MANDENLKRPTHQQAVERGRKGGLNKRGSKHLSTHIQEMLNDPNFELKLKDGSVLKGAPMAAIIKTAVAKGVSGDTRAMEWLAKHGYGTQINVNTTDPVQEVLEKFGLIEAEGDDDATKTEDAES